MVLMGSEGRGKLEIYGKITKVFTYVIINLSGESGVRNMFSKYYNLELENGYNNIILKLQ